MSREKNNNTVDWVAISLYIVLALIGIAFIYDTTYSPANPSFIRFDTSYGKQTIWLILSLIVGMVLLILDSKFYTTFAFFIYGLSRGFAEHLKQTENWF